MTSSALNLLITGRISGNDFSALLADEITTYGTLIKKKAAGIPLVFNEVEAIAIDHVWLQKSLEIIPGLIRHTYQLTKSSPSIQLIQHLIQRRGSEQDFSFYIQQDIGGISFNA